MNCVLCAAENESLVWQDGRLRVILVDDPDYPGYARVIWQDHVRELTDLSADDRLHLMRTVFAVEEAIREVVRPDKMNLASFGNMVPHLHVHLIPRFADDRHFPEPVWGAARAEWRRPAPVDRAALAAAVRARLSAQS